MTTPPAEDQIRFLNNLQRLLSEGGFTATYKFALLMALADLSVKLEHPEASAVFHINDIAAKYIEYYWRQTAPYIRPNHESPRAFFQNSNPGKEAKVLALIREMQQKCDESIAKARTNTSLWSSYQKSVAKVIEIMPLTKLQTLGREEVCFLYDNPDTGTYAGYVHLKPGVAFFLRRFHTLIKALVQDAWIRYIRGLNANQPLLGQVTDLQEFLFGSDRQDLSLVRDVLFTIQQASCFYCLERIPWGAGVVDHFIPWSRYSVDLGHNFVLAHSKCNNSKTDLLPDLRHLENWMMRNRTDADRLEQAFRKVNVACDLPTSIHITRWAYEQADLSGASVWLEKDSLQQLSPRWKTILKPANP